MAKAKRKTEAPAANSLRQESKHATDLIAAADVSLIGRCGRTITQAKDMRSVVAETLKMVRRLTPANELRVVYRSASEWKEWYATGRRIREFEHAEWPTPSPAAQTVSFDNGEPQFGFVSTSPASDDHEWVLELLAPQIAAALTMHAAVRRAQKNAVPETALVRETLRARDEERRRITHELHDDVGQTIATLKLRLKLLENQMKRDGNATKAVEELSEARHEVGSLLSKIRDLSHTLYPRILDTLGFLPALEELASQVSTSSGVDVCCTVHGKPAGRVADGDAVSLLPGSDQQRHPAFRGVCGKHRGRFFRLGGSSRRGGQRQGVRSPPLLRFEWKTNEFWFLDHPAEDERRRRIFPDRHGVGQGNRN